MLGVNSDEGFQFKPGGWESAKVLLLGSMPGVVSLDANEYYANPLNSFWRIMGNIIGFDPSAPYNARLEALKRSGIALWDVLHSCVRPGSADGAIESGTRAPNNFKTFFQSHPGIKLVCFNGAEAEKSYKRYVWPELSKCEICYVRLPSSSSAFAALSFEKKLEAWWKAICALQGVSADTSSATLSVCR
jgi:hypoxanthine-DNA glycosylase